MILKPQDILVLLKLVSVNNSDWSYSSLAAELGMSTSEVHSAIRRSLLASLAIKKGDKIIPFIRNLEEFIVHGLKFVFIPERGEMVRGIPTAHAAPPMKSAFINDGEPPPVWPDPKGQVRGMAFSPLYKSAPKAAQLDPELYELLVLVDGIRSGRAREREFAVKELKNRLKQ
jgi:hypothetical protein